MDLQVACVIALQCHLDAQLMRSGIDGNGILTILRKAVEWFQRIN